ncbi:hypothetical protein THAOC_19667 [Thalassiosira oceanica]|uniref:Uncharacterized protein n=1 Tax=Thalassiosira oceanica TaxID=159749 RepID=K0S441_THAOC|nr:hypothetical protein THAOC_19667 [Thalassiosira oceanica]|eukprot:EJK60055.1 hypothetical protein THAOC_19667 [Thalassiosira oceanica]
MHCARFYSSAKSSDDVRDMKSALVTLCSVRFQFEIRSNSVGWLRKVAHSAQGVITTPTLRYHPHHFVPRHGTRAPPPGTHVQIVRVAPALVDSKLVLDGGGSAPGCVRRGHRCRDEFPPSLYRWCDDLAVDPPPI